MKNQNWGGHVLERTVFEIAAYKLSFGYINFYEKKNKNRRQTECCHQFRSKRAISFVRIDLKRRVELFPILRQNV